MATQVAKQIISLMRIEAIIAPLLFCLFIGSCSGLANTTRKQPITILTLNPILFRWAIIFLLFHQHILLFATIASVRIQLTCLTGNPLTAAPEQPRLPSTVLTVKVSQFMLWVLHAFGAPMLLFAAGAVFCDRWAAVVHSRPLAKGVCAVFGRALSGHSILIYNRLHKNQRS